jgi:hypothetical protein
MVPADSTMKFAHALPADDRTTSAMLVILRQILALWLTQ